MKIINIASSDNFEDIRGAVRESGSDSVILVVPKSNRIFKSKTRVAQLKQYFERIGKDVSIMSSGEQTIDNAKLAGLKVSHEVPKKQKPVSPPDRDEEIASLYSEKAPTWDPERNDEGPSRPSVSYGTREPKATSSVQPKKFVLVFLTAAIFAFVLIVFTSFNQARVRIIPAKEDFSINIPVTVSSAVTEPDSIYGLAPGRTVQFEKSVTRTFSSSGEKQVFQKAKGRLTIYNNFGAAPQILVATTRFQTLEGLVFRIPEAVTVPGATQASDGLKPGEIVVDVVADRAGPEYNIGPSDFTIPGFLGSPRYKGFYAKSFEIFSGGFTGLAKVITEEDIASAENSLREELLNQVKIELASLAGLKVVDEAVDVKIEKTGDSNKAGDAAPQFRLGLKAEVFTVAFDESKILKLVSDYVRDSQNRAVLGKGLSITYSEPGLDREKKELSLRLYASGQMIQDINREKIASDILGKKSPEIKSYFNSLGAVESAQIFLSPFWVKSVPEKRSRVQIDVIVD